MKEVKNALKFPYT